MPDQVYHMEVEANLN